jgi:hypothetical protein
MLLDQSRFFKLLRTSGIDFKESIPPAYIAWRAGTTTLFFAPGLPRYQAGGIDSLKSIPGLLKGLKIRALVSA